MNKTKSFRLSVFVSGRLALLTAALVVLFASTTLFASNPQGTFEKTLQVNGPVDLEVLTHSGDVTVRAGSSGSVFIRGKIFVGDRWFGGRREEDVHAIEQNPPLRQERQQHPHRLCELPQHFRRLRDHGSRRYHHSRPQRLR